ncbi:transposase [Novosphingobium aquae]|jgi:transposase|uniref:Transposase n=1 Tax=Novosphingobium aquae TaxID=3133435 RepID=A0ABU8S5L3_9SPHN
MDEAIVTTALDTDTGVALKPFRRIEVLSGMAGRRRVWSVEQKLALVAEMERCENIAAFARDREISTALLYTWRRELRYAVEAAKLPPRNEPMFVPVVGEATPPISSDSVEVEIGGAIVRIGQAARIDMAVAIIQTLQTPAGR